MPITLNPPLTSLHEPSAQTLTTLRRLLASPSAAAAHLSRDGGHWTFSTWQLAPVWNGQSGQQTFHWDTANRNAVHWAVLTDFALTTFRESMLVVADAEAFRQAYMDALPNRPVPEVSDLSVLLREVLGERATDDAEVNLRMVSDLACQEYLIHGSLLWGNPAQRLNHILHVLAHQFGALEQALPGSEQAAEVNIHTPATYQASYVDLTRSIAGLIPFIQLPPTSFRKVVYHGESLGRIHLGVIEKEMTAPLIDLYLNCAVDEEAGHVSLWADTGYRGDMHPGLLQIIISALDQLYPRAVL